MGSTIFVVVFYTIFVVLPFKLGVCAAEGVEAKRAKTEDSLVVPTSPGQPPGRRR